MITKQYVKQMWQEAIAECAKGNNKKPDGSTYLYIRAYIGDVGDRPIPPDTVGWLSPDIKILDSHSLPITTGEIIAGTPYVINVTVTNDGDVDCFSSTVELYIIDPIIGFCDITSNIGCQTVEILAHSKTDVQFNFQPSNVLGHKCLIARVYSLFTNDFPLDWQSFSACNDRHIAQHNLTIIAQSKTISFDLNPGKIFEGKDLELSFQVDTKVVDNLDIPKIAKYTIRTEPVDFASFKVLKVAKKGSPKSSLNNEKLKRTQVKMGKNNTWAFKKVKKETSIIHIEIPSLNLRRNDALPINLNVIEKSSGHIVGGITLFVVGE